jgi:membrane protease YdiL (CAAX protease family)
MKLAIKVFLIYCVCQILSPFISMPFFILQGLLTHTSWRMLYQQHSLEVAMLIGIVIMLFYLFYSKSFSLRKQEWTYRPISFIPFVVILGAAMIFFLDYILIIFKWLPDLMKQNFLNMFQSPLGIIEAAFIGPIFEEILYRGVITKSLLKSYSPARAIIISALMFGIAHFNPAQIPTAILAGVLFAWLYYVTGSLIPGIIIHILNNSLSTFYPEIELRQIFPSTTYSIIVLCSLILLILIIFLFSRYYSVKKSAD